MSYKNILIACKNLLDIFFTIYIMRDYTENHFSYEKKIYQATQEYSRVYKKFSPDSQLQALFDVILLLGSLRYRVRDESTFEIIHEELKAIWGSAEAKFNFIINKEKVEGEDTLSSSISRFEEVYRSALQVVSKEPAQFLFFLYQLRCLDEELDKCDS